MQRLIRRGALVLGLCGAGGAGRSRRLVGEHHDHAPAQGILGHGRASAIGGGTTTTMTAVIKDEMLLVPVNNVQLLVPAGLTVTSASLPAGKPAPVVTTCQSALPCVQMTGLNLAPGKSVTLTMSVHGAAGLLEHDGDVERDRAGDGADRIDPPPARRQQPPARQRALEPSPRPSTTAAASAFTQEPDNSIVGQPITGSSSTRPAARRVTVKDVSGMPMAGQLGDGRPRQQPERPRRSAARSCTTTQRGRRGDVRRPHGRTCRARATR